MMPLALGDRVVADSLYLARFAGRVGVVVRLFVATRRDPSACGRERCDELCDHCRADGAHWASVADRAEIQVGARSFVVTADTWLVAHEGTKRARAATRAAAKERKGASGKHHR